MSDIIQDYYKKQADLHGDSWSFAMLDEIIRKKEVDAITDAMRNLSCSCNNLVLDLGCGNGYVVEQISKIYPQNTYIAADFCDVLLKIAEKHKLSNIELKKEDARKLSFENNTFGLIYTERCLINILNRDEQDQAINEIVRVLKSGGYYIMIECFTDGHENYNRARKESGLEEIPIPFFNLFFDKKRTLDFLEKDMILLTHDWVCSNFLSSHYFVTRVLHPLFCKDKNTRNSEFVKFLSSAFPPNGNYSPIQIFIFKKR